MMAFRDRLNNGKTMIRIGMTSLLLAILLPRLMPASIGDGLIDATRGLFYGIAIAANLQGVRLSCGRNCGKSA